MAKTSTSFKPGHVGNPGGRPKLPPEIKAFKNLSYKQFLEALKEYSQMSKSEIAEILKDSSRKSFDIMVAKIVEQAMNGQGDGRSLLIERLWGKVPEVSHVKNLDSALDDVPEENVIEYLRKTNT